MRVAAQYLPPHTVLRQIKCFNWKTLLKSWPVFSFCGKKGACEQVRGKNAKKTWLAETGLNPQKTIW
ncbi:MAG TPA: hypothetical protein VGN61_13410, partial [Verrucomicrobiae bacterium]